MPGKGERAAQSDGFTGSRLSAASFDKGGRVFEEAPSSLGDDGRWAALKELLPESEAGAG